MIPSLEILLSLVKGADREITKRLIYEFETLGFYREDKRQRKNFIVGCLCNNYTTEKDCYGMLDALSIEMATKVYKCVDSNFICFILD